MVESKERKLIRGLEKAGDSVCFPLKKRKTIKNITARETIKLKADRAIGADDIAYTVRCLKDYIRVTREY